MLRLKCPFIIRTMLEKQSFIWKNKVDGRLTHMMWIEQTFVWEHSGWSRTESETYLVLYTLTAHEASRVWLARLTVRKRSVARLYFQVKCSWKDAARSLAQFEASFFVNPESLPITPNQPFHSVRVSSVCPMVINLKNTSLLACCLALDSCRFSLSLLWNCIYHFHIVPPNHFVAIHLHTTPRHVS